MRLRLPNRQPMGGADDSRAAARLLTGLGLNVDVSFADEAAVANIRPPVHAWEMEPKDIVIASVLQKLPLPEAKFPEGGQLWLTVYLDGRPSAYALARPILVTLGWLNLDLELDFSGFVYAKKRVQNEPSQIIEAVDGILQVCAETELDFSFIDADTSFEPEGSTFQNLFKPAI